MSLTKIASALVWLALWTAPVVMAQPPAQTVWTFDRLDNIGGVKTTVEGNPRVVDTPLGKAIEFDGVDDAVWIEKHPLAGATTFTFEAIYRPDGGAFEQRWFHLAERDPKTGLLASAEHATTGQDANARFLFELRVVDNTSWYLDAFVNGSGYNRALIFKDKLYPVGQWYHVAQTYDGKMFRSYVNGELQGEAEIAFTPQREGATSIGTRINRRNYFKGAIRQARFTPRALTPDQFLKVPATRAALSPAGDYFVYAGSYTNPTPTTTSASKGIYAWRFDSKTGALTPVGLVAEAINPVHLWAHPNGRFLYASNWEDGTPGDHVSAFAIDRRTGKLTLINSVSARGDRANQVVLDPSGRVAATVTYNSGTFSMFGIEPDGRLTEAFYTDQHAGKPLSEKQPGPRAHGIVFSKDGRFVYVAELGLDRVYVYRVDPVKRTATPAEPPFVTMNAGGSGPRRLQLHPNGKFLYVNHETDSQVSVFEVNGANLKQVQTLSTLPSGHTGNNTTAEIQIDHSGKWLYVTNRGHDSIARYTIDPAKGTLTLGGHTPAGGRTPRNITIDPTNRYLISANQNGDNIVVFTIDAKTGNLTPTGATGQVAQPGGVYFVKAE
ncbi:MAG TPA: beta-propeller fold lactonase family protein [Vicinamibacterales bacterium]|nr:beta-propeller fold lactonase family protein [Vicinamibacterales bacterium]